MNGWMEGGSQIRQYKNVLIQLTTHRASQTDMKQ